MAAEGNNRGANFRCGLWGLSNRVNLPGSQPHLQKVEIAALQQQIYSKIQYVAFMQIKC